MDTRETASPLLSQCLGQVDKLFSWAQFVGLCAISLAAIASFGMELYGMVIAHSVNLGGLLLLFLYTEVLVMAQAAMHRDHELTVTMPIAIAIVAIGRYMVVSSDHSAVHQLTYAGAILLLVAALFLWSCRKWMRRFFSEGQKN